jgi:3-methylcrotonyl-CoA carboxylase beta subunit
MRAVVDDLNAKLAQIAGGGGDGRARQAPGRGKLLPRDRVEMLLDPATPFLEIAPLAAFGMYPEKDGPTGASGRHDRRHRPRRRRRVRDRLQRRDGQGRHLLPDHGQEAPACAGDRAAEPPALHLPGRLRRRQPAEPDEVFPDRDHFGRIFYNQAQPERARHPAGSR